MTREDRKKGFFVSFAFSSDALTEIDGYFRKSGKVIVALPSIPGKRRFVGVHDVLLVSAMVARSAARMASVVFSTVSGLREMLSMPCSTRNCANSG